MQIAVALAEHGVCTAVEAARMPYREALLWNVRLSKKLQEQADAIEEARKKRR